MDPGEIYKPLINSVLKSFAGRLKTAVLFGSQARGSAKRESDHDIFLVIENLPEEPVERVKHIRMAIVDIPLRVNTIAKTPEEVRANLTPLLLEICVDGICLYGEEYFEYYRKKAIDVLRHSGLNRRQVGREWFWQFERIPRKEWELTLEGFRELS